MTPDTVHDPDGVAVEFVDKIIMGPGAFPQVPATVVHNTSNVEKHFPFYHELLGLDFIQGAQTQGKVPNVYAPAGGESGFTGAFFGIRGSGLVIFDWLQWIESPNLPTPYAEPNHVGIVRCAIEVDDLDSAHEILKRSRWAQEYPILMGGIEEMELWAAMGRSPRPQLQGSRGGSHSSSSNSRCQVSPCCSLTAGEPSSAEPRASVCDDLLDESGRPLRAQATGDSAKEKNRPLLRRRW